MEAEKIVSSAIIGTDVEVIVINGKRYVIQSPTIHKIAGAVSSLSNLIIPDNASMGDIFRSLSKTECASLALSWLIKGDGSLNDELSAGTLEEVASGLETGFSMIDIKVFLKAVTLAKNVARMAAKRKQ